jgi:hypothetical protein
MKIEKFKERLIAFDTENETVNATDMLKLFPNKRMNDFLDNKQTREFIKELENTETDIPASAVIQIVKGGNNKKSQGTWMHKLLAYKFASWLSPEFEVFVYKVFDNSIREKLNWQQRQLDYFWDKEDQKDLYK